MSVGITKAMVLAAGLGTRMRPLTNDKPKPLIKVAGKTLLDHTLDMFADTAVNDVVVNVHYLADLIEDHLRGRQSPTIHISDERQQLLETGGGLAKAAPLLGDAPFFCTNTDAILVDSESGKATTCLQQAFDPETMDALLLLCPLERTSGYDGEGDFALTMPRTGLAPLAWRKDTRIDEKLYVYTGLQILHPRLLQGHKVEPFSARRFWDQAMAQQRLYGLIHDGDWMHVGDPQGLAAAEKRIAAMKGAG